MNNTRTTIVTSFIQLLITGCTFLFGIVMAKLFGASPEMDAYVAASTIIGLIYSLFVTVQPRVLIPFVGGLGTKERPEKVTTHIIIINIFLFSFLSISLYFGSPVVVALIVPGLDPTYKEVSTALLQVTSLYLFISNLASLGKGIVELHLKPVLSLIIRLLQAFSLFIFLYILKDRLGIFSLPWAHVLSVAVIVPLYGIFLIRKKYPLRSDLPLWNRHVKRYLQLLAPLIIGQLLMRAIKLTDTFLASFLEAGALSHISYSLRIVTNFDQLFAGVYVVYFPLLSKLSNREDNRAYMDTFYEGFQGLFFVALSLAGFLFILTPEIIQLVFQRGSFTAHDTEVVSNLIRAYSFMVLCAPLGSYLANAYYSRQDSKRATMYSVISSVINIALNFLMVRFWGVFGLAIASSIAYLAGNIILASNLKKINPEYSHWIMVKEVGRVVLMVLISSSALYGVVTLFHQLSSRSDAELFGFIVISALLYALLLLAFAYLFRFKLVLDAIDKLKRIASK